VTHGIKLLQSEIDRNMAMLGVASCSDIDRTYLFKQHPASS